MSRVRCCPSPDNSLKFRKAVGQCSRAGLQDQRRFDFVDILVPHRRDFSKPRPRYDPLGPKFLAAPRADDQIRFPLDDLLGGHNAVLGSAPVPAVGDVGAADDFDELRNPTNSGDQRIVSLLGPFTCIEDGGGDVGRINLELRWFSGGLPFTICAINEGLTTWNTQDSSIRLKLLVRAPVKRGLRVA